MALARACTIGALIGLACAGACSPSEESLRKAPPAATEAVKRVEPVAMHAPAAAPVPGNPYAYIPPQCYAKTRDDAGGVHNPCFTCHVRARAPNFIDDEDLQLAYDFAEPVLTNPWTNLFVDRTAAMEAISEAEILAWVRSDNYFDAAGEITLAKVLAQVPNAWDANGNGTWDGYVPDCWFRFDEDGFDHAPNGERTGWRAYRAYPFPGAFWPTNGSLGDFMIRLPEAFRQDEDGREDPAVYALNLAIVEGLMTRRDVVIAPTDEIRFGVDLDRDGELGTATKVVFHWAPLRGKTMSYVGRAKVLQQEDEAPIAAGLLPLGTELLHTLRYLDVDDGVTPGRVIPSRRMKEVRYARKRSWRTYGQLEQAAAAETKEKRDFPYRLRQIFGNAEVGAFNGQGWIYQAFIEDAAGELRPQSFEETMACIGCHSGVGVTTDGTYSLARKLPDDGWTHPSQRTGLAVPEPVRKDGKGEYAFYLEQVGAGDDLRNNAEILARFFDAEGKLRPDALAELRGDIASLVMPSPHRALALDRAYRDLVREQSFTRGRDVQLAPVAHAWREVPLGEETGVQTPVR